MPLPTLAVALGAFASFAGFLYGYDTGYISGCKEMPYFVQIFGTQLPDGTYHLPTSTDSLITSILSVGTCLGALAGGTVADMIGRRWGIVVYIVLFFIGVACQTGGTSLAAFAVGRVFAGLGVGGCSCIVPIYQAECAPKKIRGVIVSAFQFFITFGLLIAAIVANATKDFMSPASYQIPIGVQFIWGAIIAGGCIFLPESPRWLLLKDRTQDARRSLARLLSQEEDSPEVSKQYAEMAANLEHERSMGRSSWLDCFRGGPGKHRQRVLTGMGLQALQQLSGINFIMYYGTSFFQNSGISSPFLITIAVNVVNTGSTIPGMYFPDVIGRRPLMIGGAIGMAFCQIIVAAVGVSSAGVASQKVLVAFVCIYIFFFATTWATLAWVITSEVYPYEIRGKAMSLSTGTNW